MVRCYIALGSNLQQPLQQVRAAVRAMSSIPATQLVAVSRWYQSAAVGPGDQPDYINGVAALNSDLLPLQLLAELQAIENQQGRLRLQRWGARTLDLDLLLYGDQSVDLPTLAVPHPRMLDRAFVLKPLLEIAPDLKAPNGTPLLDILTALGERDLCMVAEQTSPTLNIAQGAAIEGDTEISAATTTKGTTPETTTSNMKSSAGDLP